jgi:uncharacterized protein (DUF488 family)
MEIWTIGHSLRSPEEVRDILTAYRIAFVADVRRFPGERKNPGFGVEAMERACLDLGMTYVGLGRQLGGARSEGYREHLDTDVFRDGLGELMELARRKRTAVFCREALYFRCHRKYIADELVREGWNVVHVLDAERCFRHRMGSYRMGSRPDESE